MTAYTRLADLAQREADLIEAGRWLELGDVAAEREALVAALPLQPPPAARAALELALALVRANEGRLVAALARTREEMEHLRRGRTAMAGYVRAADAA